MCDAFCCGGPRLPPHISSVVEDVRPTQEALDAVWTTYAAGPLKVRDLVARLPFPERQVRAALWDLLNEGCLTLNQDWTVQRTPGRSPGVPVKWDEATRSYR